ncbi:phosphate-starvation-inducible PsiE family protein [Komagataeibacter saccharivorans]|uniref:phosphate-starvation-inducible PsiE family protein n=1 Tax=Komagataeibacter saccharivorans TaxID=265959 RepID=UPI0039E72D6F
MMTRLPGFFQMARLFDLFEEGVMLILTLLIVAIAGTSLVHVVVAVWRMLVSSGLNPTSPDVLQSIFGMFFTVLIALEFKHSILVLPDAQPHSMIRMRSVLLIGMLATVRKFIVIDLKEVNVMELLSLSAAILSLGIVYWLVRAPQPAAVRTDDQAASVTAAGAGN